ncbi:NO-binding membrane sensor protein with MHYT domain [Hamadaea flava]|uniref:MHYT domain-containing protein n=1 Tax=Hamadaea flava TaxID=1742688 RepID=A0ABV8LJ30_9ACTN|nr:MHYT domain-containing protein [Hamadaea flava]MCP2325040.1 NO-binding membrane sensor protein with MHYT domain [Hamadaea flava]
MPEIHHFAYGWFNPALAYLLAFSGCLTGLVCTTRARAAGTPARRARWLILGSVSIGGAGIWLMHFMAMIGFDIPASPIRYNLTATVASLLFAVVTVGLGLFFVGTGRRGMGKLLVGGVFTGSGVVAMHYTGMYAMRVSGQISYDEGLVLASVVIAIVAATVALWFTISVQGGWKSLLTAAAVMAFAVCGMHYTAMAALRVHLESTAAPATGIAPTLLIVPIFVIAAATLLGAFVSALQAMTQEEFGSGPITPPSQAIVRVPRPRTTSGVHSAPGRD